MQNVGYDVAHMSLLGRDGRWQGVGELKWPWGGEYPKPQPLRLCYPNVIMRNRAAHFFGVGDIVEPIEAWREEKHSDNGTRLGLRLSAPVLRHHSGCEHPALRRMGGDRQLRCDRRLHPQLRHLGGA